MSEPRLCLTYVEKRQPVEAKVEVLTEPKQIEAVLSLHLQESWQFIPASPPENVRPNLNYPDSRARTEEGRAITTFTLDNLRTWTGRHLGDDSQDGPLLSFLDESVEKGRLRILRICPQYGLNFRDLLLEAEIGRAVRTHGPVPIPMVGIARFYFSEPLSRKELREGERGIESPSAIIQKLWAARDARFQENFGKPSHEGDILAEIGHAKEVEEQRKLSRAFSAALSSK